MNTIDSVLGHGRPFQCAYSVALIVAIRCPYGIAHIVAHIVAIRCPYALPTSSPSAALLHCTCARHWRKLVHCFGDNYAHTHCTTPT
jgi:hypothetical protein